jgi:hypothetical protein
MACVAKRERRPIKSAAESAAVTTATRIEAAVRKCRGKK